MKKLTRKELIQRVIDDLVSAGTKVIVVAEVDQHGEVSYILKAKFEDGTIWHIESIEETEEEIVVEGTEEGLIETGGPSLVGDPLKKE